MSVACTSRPALLDSDSVQWLAVVSLKPQQPTTLQEALRRLDALAGESHRHAQARLARMAGAVTHRASS